MTKEKIVEKAQAYFDQGYACSQSVLLAFASEYNLDEHTAKLLSAPFGGGMGRLRGMCGALTGGFMVLGLEFGNADPKDMDTKLECYRKVRELNSKFIEMHSTNICAEILNKHATGTEVKERNHHTIICREVVGDAAGILVDILNEKHVESSSAN